MRMIGTASGPNHLFPFLSTSNTLQGEFARSLISSLAALAGELMSTKVKVLLLSQARTTLPNARTIGQRSFRAITKDRDSVQVLAVASTCLAPIWFD